MMGTLASSAHQFEKIQPAHSRHVNIEDQTVAFADAVGGEEFPARAKYAPRSLRIRVEAEANPACSRHHRR